jgi:hypothetical protein
VEVGLRIAAREKLALDECLREPRGVIEQAEQVFVERQIEQAAAGSRAVPVQAPDLP